MRRRGTAGGGRGATFLLVLVVAALAYVNWRVVEMEIDISPAATDAGPAATALASELEPPAEARPLSEFDEIVRRPLFTVARRPPAAPEESAPEGAAVAAAGEAAEAPPAELQLVGIAIDGATRQALLRQSGAGEEWVREGDSFAGWRLEKVAADGIVLGSGEQSRTLSLYPAPDAAGR